MSYKKETTTTNPETGSTTERWTITANEREWTLTATRYQERDGSRSRAFWRIDETGTNRRDHDGDVNITTNRGDEPTVGVNWPCRGTQDIETTLKFKKDLGTAIQAATEAEYIIRTEA